MARKKECIGKLYDVVVNLVRRYYKIKLIEELAQNQIEIEIYGENWEVLGERYPQYVHVHQRVTPERCMELICNSKIVLNIMPWFKDGAHERIYNTMLNGAVCISDESIYLKECFQDRENIVFYNYENIEWLADEIRFLQRNTEQAKRLIENQKKIVKESTWKNRVETIVSGKFEL